MTARRLVGIAGMLALLLSLAAAVGSPTALPAPAPSTLPTPQPTTLPTPQPTQSALPTSEPTPLPSPQPSPAPTRFPTPLPTLRPTMLPTATLLPTPAPSPAPTATQAPTSVRAFSPRTFRFYSPYRQSRPVLGTTTNVCLLHQGCAPGYFWGGSEFTGGTGSCEACAVGHYTANTMDPRNGCLNCTAGQSSAGAAFSCYDCAAREYSDDGSACTDCPAGR